MRALVIAAALALLSGPAFAGYGVTMPDTLKTDLVGVRDLQAGQWLGGLEVDLLWFRKYKKVGGLRDYEKPIFYLAGQHIYNANEKAKGSVGLALGVNTGKASELIREGLDRLAPRLAPRFEWLTKLTDFVTIEYAGGYRVFGAQEGRSRWVHGVGGKLRIPIEKLWSR